MSLPASTHSPPDVGRFVVTTVRPADLGSSPIDLSSLVGAHAGRIASREDLQLESMDAVEHRIVLEPGAEPAALKAALFQEAARGSFDVAFQREAVHRRPKRLAVFDMDSTLIRIEVIDELARAHGVVDAVSAITERAMRGELDFAESLRARVALLAGLPASTLEGVAASLPLSQGVEELIRSLKAAGAKVAVASGGFDVAAAALERRLGLDHAYSNSLEVKEGVLTGKVEGPIVDGPRKAAVLASLAREQGLDPAEVLAIGDGANDLLMLQEAGLGVAFRAKAMLRAGADATISICGLDAVLAFLGGR